MVDREWYYAAAKVFYSRTKFLPKESRWSDSCADSLYEKYPGQQMIDFISENGQPRNYVKWITTITVLLEGAVDGALLEVVKMCPSLQRLHLQADCHNFSDDWPRDTGVCKEKWSKAEFEHDAPELFKLRGISTLTVERSPDDYDSTDIYTENLKTLEEALRATASQPRPADWCPLQSDDKLKTKNGPPSEMEGLWGIFSFRSSEKH